VVWWSTGEIGRVHVGGNEKTKYYARQSRREKSMEREMGPEKKGKKRGKRKNMAKKEERNNDSVGCAIGQKRDLNRAGRIGRFWERDVSDRREQGKPGRQMRCQRKVKELRGVFKVWHLAKSNHKRICASKRGVSERSGTGSPERKSILKSGTVRENGERGTGGGKKTQRNKSAWGVGSSGMDVQESTIRKPGTIKGDANHRARRSKVRSAAWGKERGVGGVSRDATQKQ